MKIEQFTIHRLRMPLRSAFETSFGRIVYRECLILEARSEGLVGYGECVADRDPGYSYETATTAWHILVDFLIPAILGVVLPSASELQGRMAFVRGHPMAKAALEMAWWDLEGKRQGKSLRELFGGIHPRVEVGVSVGIQASPQGLVDTVARYVSDGYRRVKIKIKPGRDVNEASAVRIAFPQLRLQVDANSAYSLESAQSILPLDDLDLLLIEQPLAEDDLWDHSRLQARLRTPICLDESILTARHARQALEIKACRVINIKAGRVGGLSQALLIHDLCQEHAIPVWCGGMLETGIGRAANLGLASLPNFSLPGDISATDRYYERDITQQRFKLNPDSTIDVPVEPGLGVSLDRSALLSFVTASVDVKK